MRGLQCGLAMLMALSSPGLAASVQGPRSARPLVATSSKSGFDRVPIAAERIAAAYGVVTSTFRTVAHNREVGGVPDSYHLLGRAIDVARRRGISHAQVAAALRAAGYALVESLDEGDHSHFAFGIVARGKSRPKSTGLIRAGLAADDHGVLLRDLNIGENAHGSGGGPVLRIHIRARR